MAQIDHRLHIRIREIKDALLLNINPNSTIYCSIYIQKKIPGYGDRTLAANSISSSRNSVAMEEASNDSPGSSPIISGQASPCVSIPLRTSTLFTTLVDSPQARKTPSQSPLKPIFRQISHSLGFSDKNTDVLNSLEARGYTSSLACSTLHIPSSSPLSWVEDFEIGLTDDFSGFIVQLFEQSGATHRVLARTGLAQSYLHRDGKSREESIHLMNDAEVLLGELSIVYSYVKEPFLKPEEYRDFQLLLLEPSAFLLKFLITDAESKLAIFKRVLCITSAIGINETISYLCEVATFEVVTKPVDYIFADSSAITKLIDVYIRVSSTESLRRFITPFIRTIASQGMDCDLTNSNGNLNHKIAYLEFHTLGFIRCMTECVSRFPYGLRKLLAHIRAEVVAQYPECLDLPSQLIFKILLHKFILLALEYPAQCGMVDHEPGPTASLTLHYIATLIKYSSQPKTPPTEADESLLLHMQPTMKQCIAGTRKFMELFCKVPVGKRHRLVRRKREVKKSAPLPVVAESSPQENAEEDKQQKKQDKKRESSQVGQRESASERPRRQSVLKSLVKKLKRLVTPNRSPSASAALNADEKAVDEEASDEEEFEEFIMAMPERKPTKFHDDDNPDDDVANPQIPPLPSAPSPISFAKNQEIVKNTTATQVIEIDLRPLGKMMPANMVHLATLFREVIHRRPFVEEYNARRSVSLPVPRQPASEQISPQISLKSEEECWKRVDGVLSRMEERVSELQIDQEAAALAARQRRPSMISRYMTPRRSYMTIQSLVHSAISPTDAMFIDLIVSPDAIPGQTYRLPPITSISEERHRLPLLEVNCPPVD